MENNNNAPTFFDPSAMGINPADIVPSQRGRKAESFNSLADAALVHNIKSKGGALHSDLNKSELAALRARYSNIFKRAEKEGVVKERHFTRVFSAPGKGTCLLVGLQSNKEAILRAWGLN